WVTGELMGRLNRENLDITASPVTAEQLASLLLRIADGTISGSSGKGLLQALWSGEGDVDELIAERGLRQISDSGALDALVTAVIAAHPEQAEQFRAGKEKVLGFLVGQVMRSSRGSANPTQVGDLLRHKLGA
ncbi:MAG TPA: Asp-tRNA(Asn)/Glu-tRNA(Gln) amidotransferase GatCAB subunit B, partial [Pseudomonadales bacterium]|nr:Asp-tRNA(Asn)/Glu-tRNA(Gln) amidotransferase GatCAB subunit B [Pseudomonadales bacterium]